MVEVEMERIREEVFKKFLILDMVIWYRYGEFDVGEDIILIVVSVKYRKEVFRVCEWVIDEVK